MQSALNAEIGGIWIGDPHRHKSDGLINRLGQVASLPNIHYNESNLEIKDLLRSYYQAMQRRINGRDLAIGPLILVLDEFLSVVRHVPMATEVLRTLGTEGRGHECYGLFTAHSWVGRDVGGTVGRDNLTSTICHRLKRSQANTLLQDNELARQTKNLGKGEIIFAPVSGSAEKLHVPLCSSLDAFQIYEMALQNQNSNTCFNQPVDQGVAHSLQRAATPVAVGQDTLILASDFVRRKSLSELAEKTGINKGTLSRVLNGDRTPTDEQLQALRRVLQQEGN
jgi:hypothetical protein